MNTRTRTAARRMAAVALMLIAAFTQATAQQGAPPVGCMDAALRTQALTIKEHYQKQGFDLFRDAMFTMERDQQMPVILTLERGQIYEVVFIAHPQFKSMMLRLFDGQDNNLKELEAVRNRDQPNYLIYTFTPTKTDNYLIMSSQNTKLRQMCGAFFILKADPKKAGNDVKHYTGG